MYLEPRKNLHLIGCILKIHWLLLTSADKHPSMHQTLDTVLLWVNASQGNGKLILQGFD